MELINGSGFDLQATQGLDKQGQPWLVALAKATYRFEPDETGRPQLAEKQNQLMASDTFEGEPGLSTPFFESDYVPLKRACDVVLKGSAHAPWVRSSPGSATHIDTSLAVQSAMGVALLHKRIRVYGERRWVKRLGALWMMGDAQPFSSMPVTYSRAFGGLFTHESIGSSDPRDFLAHPMNLVGRGYGKGKFMQRATGALAHQTELWHSGSWQSVGNPSEDGVPASYGPIARNWQPRLAFAGTYDQHWQDEVFPLLPADFDERYYQCAPLDQQMPFPRGGEIITLGNLSLVAAQNGERSRGLLSFRLPPENKLALPMVLLPKNRQQIALKPVVDTISIDADAGTYDITWRANAPLKRSLHEVHTLAAGSVCKRWWKSRVYGTDDCGCGGFETDDEDLAPVDQALADTDA
jgi:hypothetical protein